MRLIDVDALTETLESMYDRYNGNVSWNDALSAVLKAPAIRLIGSNEQLLEEIRYFRAEHEKCLELALTLARVLDRERGDSND